MKFLEYSPNTMRICKYQPNKDASGNAILQFTGTQLAMTLSNECYKLQAIK